MTPDPFNTSLEELVTYLAHFDRTRGQVADLMSIDADEAAVVKLGISRTNSQIITTPDTDLAGLQTLYRVTFTETEVATLPKIPVVVVGICVAALHAKLFAASAE